MNVAVTAAGLEVELSNRSTTFTWGWLRDHCDDATSQDADTAQRLRATYGHENHAPPQVQVGATAVSFEWPDAVTTSISLDRLGAVVAVDGSTASAEPSGPGPRFPTGTHRWDADRPLAPNPLHSRDATRADLLARLVSDGFAVVDGLDKGERAVDALASNFGYVRTTIFGRVWELAADLTDHHDSAYGTTFLGPHTDATYMHDAPGLQLFVCQERDGTGGDSILVDGFAGVERLSRDDPRAVDRLAAHEVVGRYLEPGVHLEAARPAVRLDRHGVVRQVSFNNYDRAPFHHGDDDPAFRTAYAAFGTELENASHWNLIEWQPGRALIFDNWRVLHGRTAFTGSRRFLGAYVNHEDLESAVRLADLSR